MTHDRRTFLASALGTGLSASLGAPLLAATRPPTSSPKLKILILGGTGFLGPRIVRTAVANGHEVTLFNRGRTNPHLFPDLEKIQGDRNEDLSPLAGRKWDAVVDTSGYFPKQIDAATAALKDATDHYLFVSTLSVFGRMQGELDETSPVVEMTDEQADGVTSMRQVGPLYGELKARCERACEAAMPGRVTNVRPGLIVGPDDRSDRFTYWPARIRRGGEVLAPENPDIKVQFIDVLDCGEWIVHLLEQKTMGVFNTVGFEGPITLQEVLHGCKIVLGADCTFTWVDAEFLREQGIRPWMGSESLPLWVPGGRATYVNTKAREAGLTFRPLGDTIQRTIDWFEESGKELQRSGVSATKETEVLKAWHARAK